MKDMFLFVETLDSLYRNNMELRAALETGGWNMSRKKAYTDLMNVIAGIDDPSQLKKFFKEILTEKEIDDLTMRWELLRSLYFGETQRAIAEKNSISLCKITRGAKILKKKNSVTKKILKWLYEEKQ